MLWVLRGAATLEAVAMLLQAGTAGGLIEGATSARTMHGWGALLVIVLALVQLIAATLMWRPTRGPGWPALLCLVILLVGVMQSALGGSGNLSAHVPVGVMLVGLTTWLLVWSWSARRPGGSAPPR